jgi:ketosteroid isomerase-like protein
MRSHVWTGFVFVVLTAACGGEHETLLPPQPPPPPPPSLGPSAMPAAEPTPAPEPAKPIWPDLVSGFLKNTAAAIGDRDAKKYAECFTEDAVLTEYGHEEIKGRDAIRRDMQELIDGFVDLKVSGSRVFVKNDVGVSEWVLSGTNKGEFHATKPTGKPIGVRGAWVVWLGPGGLATKAHLYMDGSTVMGQLGKLKGHEVRPVAAPPMGQPEMKGVKGLADEEKNVEVVKALYAAVEKKSDSDFVAGLTDSAVWTDLTAPKDIAGKQEVKAWFSAMGKAFPDAKVAPQNAWAVEDYVICEAVMTGTQTGLLGAVKPTKKPVTLHHLDIMQLKDGKVARAVTYGNDMESKAQLGLLPQPRAVKDAPPAEKPKK